MSGKVLTFEPRDEVIAPRSEFFCIVCEELCELDDHEPFCSDACRQNYDGPPDNSDAWAGGFAENH